MTARCVVCGGPHEDGSGCEFCPAVDERPRTDPAVDRELVELADELARLLELEAEYVLLTVYDRMRARAGYDYGVGQRSGELSRRRRELESRGSLVERLELEHWPQPMLAGAFYRVGRRRLRAAERQVEWIGSGSRGADRTLDTWRRLERLYGRPA